MKSVSLLGLSLGILFILLTLQPQLELKRSQTREFLSGFKKAVVTSYRELVQSQEALESDEELKSFITQNKTNMLRGSIHRNISPGMIDAIFVFTGDCKLLASSTKGIPPRHLCSGSSGKYGSFFWSRNKGLANLNFSKEISIENKKYFIINQVKIGGIWLDRFNRLPKLSEALQVHFDSHIETNNSLLLASEGTITGKKAAFGVYAKDPILNLFPAATSSSELSLNKEIYWMSLLLLFISLRILFDLRNKRDEQRTHIEKFNRWLTTLNPKLNPRESENLDQAFKNLKEGVTSLFKDSFDQLEVSRQRVRSLIEKQSELEAKILGFKKEHLQYHQSESMREQMKKTEKTQSRLLADIYSQLEDLSDLLVHGMAQKAHGLYNFSQSWQTSLEKTSARKFLRTLSERIDDNGISELDKDLAVLFSYSQYIGNQSLNTSMQSRKLLSSMKSLVVAHKHWFNLSHNETGKELNYKLEESLIESQVLIEMEELKEKISYDNQCDETELLGIQSKEAWTSAFYHIQKATYKIAKELNIDNINIQNRLRDTNSHFLLVSSITNEETDKIISSKLSEDIQKELDLASRLMEKWDAKVTILPTVSSIPAIAVKWSKELIEKAPAELGPSLSRDRNFQTIDA